MPAPDSDDLPIFDVGSCRSMIRAPTVGTVASGTTNVSPVVVVEADGQVAGELEVLALVLAHRDPVGVVEEDVGRHEGRVGEQGRPHRLLAVRLLLELDHPVQLAVGDGGLHQPAQLGVLGHVALDEEGGDVGVEADGHQHAGQLQGAFPQLGGVVLDGEGVEVDHRVEGVGLVLLGHPVPERAQVVARGGRVRSA